MRQEARRARFPPVTEAFQPLSLSELNVRMAISRATMYQVRGTPPARGQAPCGRGLMGSSTPPCQGGSIISERSLVIQKVEVMWLKSYSN